MSYSLGSSEIKTPILKCTLFGRMISILVHDIQDDMHYDWNDRWFLDQKSVIDFAWLLIFYTWSFNSHRLCRPCAHDMNVSLCPFLLDLDGFSVWGNCVNCLWFDCVCWGCMFFVLFMDIHGVPFIL